MTEVTYKIPNISCGHCVNSVQTEVSELEGVQSVVANADTKVAKIVFGDPASEDKIISILKEINYPPEGHENLLQL